MTQLHPIAAVNEQGFAAVYDQYRLPILAYCRRRTTGVDAADACSETFLVAWRRREELPGEPKTLPYLYGIARNVIANQRRSGTRRTRLHTKLRSLDVATGADPSTVVVRRAVDRQVEDAVRRLKPRDREIVMLYAWEELPRSVIAEMMGMSRSAIDQRIHRAYKRLAKVLKPVMDSEIGSPPVAEQEGT
ncbi:MAG: RNA polymerase sigma factor [Acidimicrobiia bacterium]